MELQGRVEELRRRGLGLAVVTYDSRETLRSFASARGITFPLLSDAGSRVIRAYGLLNTAVDPADRSHGIPYPGTWILDANGKVTSRFVEPAYQTRNTVSSIMVRLGETLDDRARQATKLATRHVEVLAYASDAAVAPGQRFSLVLDVTPLPKMHVYAAGQHGYRPIRLTLTPADDLRVYPMEHPPSETYHFVPLDERVPVYMKPFRLVQDVELIVTPARRALAADSKQTVTLQGVLEYQACDDAVCYLPQRLPLTWTVTLAPLVRQP